MQRRLAGRLDRGGEVIQTLPFNGHRRRNRETQRLGQRVQIDGQAALCGFVHHIQSQQHGVTHLGQLHREQQGAMQVFRIPHLQDRL